jgi:pyruvate formate lyase activating enzyme
VTVETSLHVTPWMLHDMSLYIDDYVVDVKDMNPEIYKKYTGQDNNVVISNLEWLIEKGKADHILVRLPLIPGYNTDEDRQKSKQTLERMGITRFNLFTYKTNTYKK